MRASRTARNADGRRPVLFILKPARHASASSVLAKFVRQDGHKVPADV